MDFTKEDKERVPEILFGLFFFFSFLFRIVIRNSRVSWLQYGAAAFQFL
jgi:hypothetical protein